MSKVRFSITMSIDGYIAGPNPSVENPLGKGGEQLHEWALALEAWRRPHGLEGGETNESTPVMEATQENVGAYLMGRNMFGGGPGAWGDDPWNGWWGDDPPFHAPVFVATHHAREPLELQGGTTFTFVTDGVEAALEQARAAAGDRDVLIAGGASVVGQCLDAARSTSSRSRSPRSSWEAERRCSRGARDGAVGADEVVPAPGVAHVT